MFKPIALAATAAILAVSPAMAEGLSLKVRQYHADEERRFAEDGYIQDMNEACGTDMPASISWDNFPSDDTLFSNSINGRCESVVAAMKSICARDLGKEAVSTTINAVVCRYGDFEQTNIDADGTFNAYFTWDTPNLDSKYRDFLENNL